MQKLSITLTLILFTYFNASGGVTGLKFEAPTINGKVNVDSPEVGEIIYDSSDSTFYGRTNSSTWTAISNNETTITSWTSYTPTGTWTTNTTYTGMYKRIGDSLSVQIKVAVSGGSPNSSTLWVDIPSSFTIDSTKLVQGLNAHQIIGKALFVDASVGRNYWGAVTIKNNDNNTLQLKVMKNVDGYDGNKANVTETRPFA